MGAWGVGSFDNDDARDWIPRLQKSRNESTLRAAVNAVVGGEGPPAAAECCVALAACEVVATLRGHPPEDLPAPVGAWCTAHAVPPSATLVAAARAAVDAMLSESELRDLWDDGGRFDEWRAILDDLTRRLS